MRKFQIRDPLKQMPQSVRTCISISRRVRSTAAADRIEHDDKCAIHWISMPVFGQIQRCTSPSLIRRRGSPFTSGPKKDVRNAMVANSVQAHEQGRAAGATAGLYSLTSIIGPLAAGFAYDYISGEAVFVAGGVLIALTALIIGRVRAGAREPQMTTQAQG